MLRIHHPVFGRYYRISWNGIYHIPYRYIMIITEYNILWNIVTIYIYLFPIVWGSNIGPQAHNGPTIRCGFWGSPSDPSPEASERWQDAGQFIAGLLVPHMLPGDFLGCYLFIFVLFAKQHSLEFMIYYMYDMYFFDAHWSCGRCSHCFVLIQCYLPVKPVSAGMCWLGASWGWNQSWLLPGLPAWVSNHGY